MKINSEKWRNDRMRLCTMTELAEKTGVSYDIVRKIEAGKKRVDFDEPNFLTLCEHLKFRPEDYLVKETKIVSVLSNKGGATKTTTVVNLAYALATDYGRRVLVIDTDVQQNMTQNFGVHPLDTENFFEAFSKGEDIRRHIRGTKYGNIDIVTSHDNMSLMDKLIRTIDFSEYRMGEILEKLVQEGIYDYIIIDCNPSLNDLNTSILFGSDELIAPLYPGAFGRKGMRLVLDFYNGVAKRRDGKVKLTGIIVNRFDKRKVAFKEVLNLVREDLENPEKVLFKTLIPEDANIEKGQLMDEPIAVSFPSSRAVEGYRLFAKEVIERVEKV